MDACIRESDDAVPASRAPASTVRRRREAGIRAFDATIRGKVGFFARMAAVSFKHSFC